MRLSVVVPGLLLLALSCADCAPSRAREAPASDVPSVPSVDGGAAEAAPAGPHAVRYLALGDSFTIGTGSPEPAAFPARLAGRWTDAGCSVELRNVAVNGFATEDVIDIELPVLASFHPSFVTVAAGANDIVRGFSADVYRTNVRHILAALRSTGAKVVAIPQPDWSRSPRALAFGDIDALQRTIVQFNGILAEEVATAGFTWVDLWTEMQEQAAQSMLASDKLHPSAEAYDAWAGSLARALPAPCP